MINFNGGAKMSDSNRVSACVFDFGGVMTLATMPDKVRTTLDRLGVEWSVVTEGYAKFRRQLDGNFISFDDMYDLIFADNDIELSESDKKELIENDISSFHPCNEKTLAFMREIKERGYKIGILTNMPTAFVPSFKKYYKDFIALADAMVISGEEKMYKPQRRIYRLMTKRLNVEPEEICFFDDVEANCESARSCGWKAIRFTDIAQAMREFEELVARDQGAGVRG